jgi:hypothetical protein
MCSEMATELKFALRLHDPAAAGTPSPRGRVASTRYRYTDKRLTGRNFQEALIQVTIK